MSPVPEPHSAGSKGIMVANCANRWFRVPVVVAAYLLPLLIASPAAAQPITPFSPRFSATDTGEIVLVANTVVQPDPSDPGAIDARNGVGTRLNNNNFTMVNVDVDSDVTTFNSSTADLNLPGGATVLFAGLYWGADSNSALRNQVLLATPAAGAYTTITGAVLGAFGNDYQAFADVTPLVQTAGNGTYTVANVQASVNASDRHGGWTIVIVYRAPGLPAKDLTVFDGFARVANSTGANNVSVTITGFTAPPTGPVNAAIGVVAYEGDRGSTGDRLQLNGTTLSDAANPPTNFFNSSISAGGTNVTTKNPHQISQLGFDAVTIATTNIIPNGATSATISLTTGGETYFPGVVATAIDLFSPEIESVKSFTDLNGGEIVAGDVIEYEIALTNTGQDAAANLVFVDPIPANTTYVAGSLQIVAGANAGAKTDGPGDDQAEFDGVGNRVVFRLGSGASGAAGGMFAIGDTATVRFRVSVNGDTPNRTVIVNQGSSTFTGLTTGFPLAAETNEAGFTVDARSDLQLSKAVDNATPNVGDTIAFTLSVSNLGPSPATSVVVQDSLPAGLSFVSASASHGSYSHATGAWTIGTLASGATAQLVIHVMVTAPASTNTATASSAVQDPNPANNTATAVLTVQEADLVLGKSISNATPNVGDLVTFTLTLANNGPGAATNVLVSDPLPLGLSFQSATPTVGSYDSLSGIWSVGTLPAGVPAALSIQAQVNSVVPQTNSAVASADQFDPDATNNSASVVATPQRADLAMSKTVSNATPNVGDPLTYTVTITNLGPDAATSVSVQDTLPAGVPFVSATPSQGAFDSATGSWTIGTLANGATATLGIQVTVTFPNPALNFAFVSASDQFDPVAGNDSATASIAPPLGDLSLTKTVSDGTPNVGDVITFTLALTNAGPDDVPSVLVSDPLPAGLVLLNATATQGSYAPVLGVWNVGVMASGATATLTMTARVDSPSSVVNVATASSSTFDPDPSDNTGTVGVSPQQADLVVTKAVSNPSPTVGSTITFTVEVGNNGPDTATNVAVRDLLPAGLALVSATPSVGTYNTAGAWTVGTLANGATATLSIDATVLAGGSATNFATVSADQFDPAPGDGSASATATAAAATGVDIAVAITAAPVSTVTGDIVTLTVVATNNGPGNATSLAVEIPLPGEVTVHGSNATVGTFDPGTSQWTIGSLATGSAATLQIALRITTAFSADVTASRAALAETDTNAANDSATASLLARDWSTFLSDLVLDGATTAPTVAPGGLIGYNLTAVNRGPTYVVDLSITGSVPPGTTFASATPSAGGVCTTPAVGDVGAVTCTWPGVTMLDPGAARTLAVGVRADAGAAVGTTVTGQFQVTSLTGEYYEPSNHVTLTASVSGGSTADLAVTALMQSEGVTGTALAVPVGVPTPMRFTVRNLGPAATVDARYAIEIPDVDISAIRILGAGVTQGAVGLTGVSSAEWHVGALAPGASATFTLSVAMQSMRVTTVTMRRVESTPGDPANANDRATLSLDGTGDPGGGERWAAIGNIDGVGLKEVIVGAGRLETPQVRIFTGDGRDTGLHFHAYDRNFVGGVRVATCDVDGDGIDEIITGPGLGPGPHIRVLRMQGQVVTEVIGFYAFDPTFAGGLYVACADVDNDGRADVVAGMGEGGSEVRVFDVGPGTVAQKASFVAYEPAFTGGVRVAAVAANEPGGTQYQVVTVPGPGRPLEVRAWLLAGAGATLARAVPVTGPEYQLGAFVDVADVDGDGRPEAMLATDRGIPGLVGAVTIDSARLLGIFQPFPSSFLGGVRVALGDIDADGRLELLVTPGPGGRPRLDTYTISGGVVFRYRLTPIEVP